NGRASHPAKWVFVEQFDFGGDDTRAIPRFRRGALFRRSSLGFAGVQPTEANRKAKLKKAQQQSLLHILERLRVHVALTPSNAVDGHDESPPANFATQS